MLGLFKRTQKVADAGELGRSMVALPLRAGCTPPAACPLLIVDASGHTRRAAPARRVELRDGEQGWAWHPGPYTVDLAPFAQAPEVGLRTRFAIEPELEGARQRFELLLAAEADGPLPLAALARALESALQRELAAGALELPPCTTIEEWNAFRQGFDQLCYMRFGLSVDDCVPVDLGASVDYAALLAARAFDAQPSSARLEPVLGRMPAARPARIDAPGQEAAAPCPVGDARALRRLFIELPGLMCGLRLAALPAGQDQFRRQQALLQRLDLLSVSASTMPALGLAAPGRPLAMDAQARRARHALRACASLDEAWALLARFRAQAAQGDAGGADGSAGAALLYDEAERIVANLELDCGARRAAGAAPEPEADADAAVAGTGAMP
ncbi:hypothetical protein [Massilia sp. 9096]|uniref:hypothetical protein n=1 Tax=Massilia sp. 9096 TaxID=1500894 RepID=UPI000689F3C2|nr:hypothetical protein [Massilia sp. 9096]